MGKRAAWISGAAAAAVLAVGLLFSRELAVRFQTARMDRDLDLFLEGLVEPEGTVAAAAARRVAASGRLRGEVLLEIYLEVLEGLDENFQKVLQQHREVYEQTRLSVGSGGGLAVTGVLAEDHGYLIKPASKVTPLHAPEPVLARLRAIQELLAKEGFSSAGVSSYPGAEFSFRRVATTPPATSLISTNRQPELHYCAIRWPERDREQHALDDRR